jgi:hypothetical protein
MMGLYENEVSNWCAEGDHERCKHPQTDHDRSEERMCQCLCHVDVVPS